MLSPFLGLTHNPMHSKCSLVQIPPQRTSKKNGLAFRKMMVTTSVRQSGNKVPRVRDGRVGSHLNETEYAKDRSKVEISRFCP
jgi:hypothetical protein